VVLDSELREQLDSLADSRSFPAGLVRRAKIILLSASAKNDREIAAQLETSRIVPGKKASQGGSLCRSTS
jgi:hypothetical protein